MVMNHYEERMQRDLDEIKALVAEIGEQVEEAVRRAVRALLHRDTESAAKIVLADHPINRATREADRLCHLFVARHLPSAGVLRTISSVLRLTIALERVGDYAVTLARETAQLHSDVPETIARDAELVAEHSLRVLHEAMGAFNSGNAERARTTMTIAREARRTSHRVFRDMVQIGEGGGLAIADLYALLLCINRMERIGDQAKNICEETVFAMTGEVKRPKVYRVLFVDRTNDTTSQMAVAIARASYPESGVYTCAGWQPTDQILPAVADFLERRGHAVSQLTPAPFDTTFGELEHSHVIVDLDGGAAERITDLPFHTTVTRWSVGPSADDAGGMLGDAFLTEVYRDLSAQIATLMETLRGEQAR
jgi:phosphate transport system protein